MCTGMGRSWGWLSPGGERDIGSHVGSNPGLTLPDCRGCRQAQGLHPA